MSASPVDQPKAVDEVDASKAPANESRPIDAETPAEISASAVESDGKAVDPKVAVAATDDETETATDNDDDTAASLKTDDEDAEEGTVTIAEYVAGLDAEIEKGDLERAAVYGTPGTSDKCTYEQGYVARQAVLACMTCTPEAASDPLKRAGVCAGCAEKCHAGHELIELYTKRRFRCDCGTSRMLQVRCSLNADKAERNEANVYDHNFSGRFCTCEQLAYPEVEESMSQCCVCEDWFHDSHQQLRAGEHEEVGDECELVCAACMKRCDLLQHYVRDRWTAAREVDVQVIDDADDDAVAPPSTKKQKLNDATEVTSATEQPVAKAEPAIASVCRKPTLRAVDETEEARGVLWPFGWRARLCRCAVCSVQMQRKKIEFLLDEEDAVHVYAERNVERAKEAKSEGAEKVDLVRMTAGMGHRAQVDLVSGLMSFKERMVEFLSGFEKSKKEVTKKDVKDFFQALTDERRAMQK